MVAMKKISNVIYPWLFTQAYNLHLFTAWLIATTMTASLLDVLFATSPLPKRFWPYKICWALGSRKSGLGEFKIYRINAIRCHFRSIRYYTQLTKTIYLFIVFKFEIQIMFILFFGFALFQLWFLLLCKYIIYF